MNLSFTWTDLRNYVILLLIFLVIDAVWLLGIARGLYAKQLEELMAPKPKWIAAGLFYLLYALGLLLFVVRTALVVGRWEAALLPGLLFGLIAYATYDLTNQATVRNWPVLITVVDLLWGATVSGLTSLFSYWIIRRLP
ncbi:MAG: DUF2177 family protein [Clostridiales bacterium]|nr:DUF2177 family protein [Clostridiales bacterium]